MEAGLGYTVQANLAPHPYLPTPGAGATHLWCVHTLRTLTHVGTIQNILL